MDSSPNTANTAAAATPPPRKTVYYPILLNKQPTVGNAVAPREIAALGLDADFINSAAQS